MTRKKNKEAASRSPTRLIIVRILMVVAVLLAIYLLRVSLTGGNVPGCAPGSGCDQVLNSNWAYWLTIPVSALALLLYTVVLLATFWLGPRRSPLHQRNAWLLLLPAAVLIILSACWFVALQFAVLKSVCPFCMAAHAIGLVAALLLLFAAPLKLNSETTKSKAPNRPTHLAKRQALLALLPGLALFGALAAGQLLAPRPNYVLQVFDGKFQIDVNAVPVLGKPSAPNRMLSLFDYTCHYCRILHGRLKLIHETFEDELCIVNLPMPLDSRCNHLVKQNHPDHAQACDYAKLGLAVWRANRTRFHDYTDWVFSPEKIPSLDAARVHARTLVGNEELEIAMRDPWISQQISNNVAIYAASPKGNMPQMMIGTNITYGTPLTDEIYSLIEAQLGLSRNRVGRP